MHQRSRADLFGKLPKRGGVGTLDNNSWVVNLHDTGQPQASRERRTSSMGARLLGESLQEGEKKIGSVDSISSRSLYGSVADTTCGSANVVSEKKVDAGI